MPKTTYTFEGNNPMAYFGDQSAEKKIFSEEEIFKFYYAHFPEKVTATFDEVKEWLVSIKANIQRVENNQ